MITKSILRSLLLIIVLGSLAIWGNREYQKSRATSASKAAAAEEQAIPVVDGPQVVVTYFLMGTRCPSCKKIEALAKETVEQDFATEKSNNKIILRIINTDDAAHRHYIEDYKLAFKTVVISRRLNGKEIAWANMEKVWDLLDDGPAYHAYLGDQIRAYLHD